MYRRNIQYLAEWLLRRIGYVPTLWHVDDVAACAEDNDIGFVPTREQCFEVLDDVRRFRTAGGDMSWDAILAELEAIRPGQEGAAS
jgi:hypothetical protein